MNKLNDNIPEVSVVIATYNRPEILRSCLQAVINQSFKKWVVYVIGDNCTESTKDAVESLNDKRIVYYNNPFRFGEQPGGNNLGIAFSKTEYIAFLNHDDIWTPNHLEVALKYLNKNDADLFVGRSINYSKTKNSIPQLGKVSNKNIRPFWIFTANYGLFEPCSTWVVKNTFAHKVGYWRQSVEIHRFPVQDYLMRAWKLKAKFVFPSEITCIRMIQHLNIEENRYSYVGNESDYLFQLFNNTKLFNQLLTEENLISYPYSKNYWKRRGANRFLKFLFNIVYDLFVNRLTAHIYFYTGIDSHSVLYDMMFQKRGANMKKTLKKRTGETELKRYNMDEVIQYAKEKMEGIL